MKNEIIMIIIVKSGHAHFSRFCVELNQKFSTLKIYFLMPCAGIKILKLFFLGLHLFVVFREILKNYNKFNKNFQVVFFCPHMGIKISI